MLKFLANLQNILNQSVSVWLGGNDLGSNGVWTWIDGHNMTYTNWAKGNKNHKENYDSLLSTFF